MIWLGKTKVVSHINNFSFLKNIIYHRRLVSLVGKVPVHRVGGSGSIPDRINTQGLKIIEEKVLPLFL